MLTNYERETIITFNEAETDCEIYTYNQKLINKLSKLSIIAIGLFGL